MKAVGQPLCCTHAAEGSSFVKSVSSLVETESTVFYLENVNARVVHEMHSLYVKVWMSNEPGNYTHTRVSELKCTL